MNKQRILELLQIELECIQRNEQNICNRDCANCDLVQTTDELIKMYTTVIEIVKEQ